MSTISLQRLFQSNRSSHCYKDFPDKPYIPNSTPLFLVTFLMEQKGNSSASLQFTCLMFLVHVYISHTPLSQTVHICSFVHFPQKSTFDCKVGNFFSHSLLLLVFHPIIILKAFSPAFIVTLQIFVDSYITKAMLS